MYTHYTASTYPAYSFALYLCYPDPIPCTFTSCLPSYVLLSPYTFCVLASLPAYQHTYSYANISIPIYTYTYTCLRTYILHTYIYTYIPTDYCTCMYCTCILDLSFRVCSPLGVLPWLPVVPSVRVNKTVYHTSTETAHPRATARAPHRITPD